MALTNFGRLTDHQYTVWSRDFWREARNRTFIMNFAGSGQNSMVQRITELKTTRDGARAVITLLHDSLGDGVVGDNRLKDRESPLTSADQVIQIDQWRDAHRTEGEMAEQASLVKVRDVAKNALAYTASRVMDELAFLTLSGVSYAYHTNGALRIGSELPQLKYAADITAPSGRRHFRWSSTTGLSDADTSSVAATDTPSWEMLVDLKAKAVNSYLRPILTENGIETYNVFMTPDGIAALKKDKDFLAAWQHAQKRGEENPIFKGTQHGGKRGIHIDGLNILEYRNVYNTAGMASGSKWGSAGTVDGQRVLLCGAQALAFADIGTAKWTEDTEDYENQWGIAVAKKYGFLKPNLLSIHSQTVEDFSVICCDTAV